MTQSKSDPNLKNKMNRLIHVPVREVKLSGVLATDRVNTPSTPMNNTESQVTLGGPGGAGAASGSKSFYEKLSDLQSPEQQTNAILIQTNNSGEP